MLCMEQAKHNKFSKFKKREHVGSKYVEAHRRTIYAIRKTKAQRNDTSFERKNKAMYNKSEYWRISTILERRKSGGKSTSNNRF